MNISNVAYHKPLTIYNPGLQKEGYDPVTGNVDEGSWYAPTEKVIPRVYHKYLKATDLKNIYGSTDEEESESDDNNNNDDNQNPDIEPDQPVIPDEDQPAEPENP